MSTFRFKQFSVENTASAMKLGTDSVLLGSMMTLPEGARRLLDVGTGTGVIALMIAQRLSGTAAEQRRQTDPEPHEEDFHIDAIDIDGPSVGEAADNFAASPWAANLSAVLTPLQQYSPDGPIDVIFSNPPFFDDSLLNPDPRESRARHTSTLSYRDILSFASQALSPGGQLSMVLPADCETALRRCAVSFGLYPSRIVRIRTVRHKPCKRIVAEFTRQRGEVLEEEVVMQENGVFTESYRRYVAAFLLSLQP